MGYQFILLLGHGDPSGVTSNANHVEETLLSRGLKRRWGSSFSKLFTSDQTPVLILQDRHIVIGHLFNHDYKLVTDSADLPPTYKSRTLQKCLLEDCWGEYLLLGQEPDRPFNIRVDRDPSGGVPCIHSVKGANGFITSDISLATSLGLIEKQIDWQQLAHGLAYPRFKTGRTGLVDVSELLPGCSLTIENASATTKCEWLPWRHVSGINRHTDPVEAVNTLRNVIVRVVGSWANTDRSALLELSGGLDSSIVGACLRNTEARIVCSTLVTAVPGADERMYASLIADLLGVDLRSDELPLDSAQFEFSVPAHSVTPAVGLLQYASNSIKEAVAQRFSVNAYYSGGGGDTVFCYLKTAAPAADAFLECGVIGGLRAIRNLADLHQCTIWKAARLTARKLLQPQQLQSVRDLSFLSPRLEIPSGHCHPWFPVPAGTLPGDRERALDLAGTQMFRDSVPRGRDRWFRMPLLSQPVVEACLRIPSWMWIANGENRSVARSAFSTILPKEILDRRSKGTFMNFWGAAYHRNRMQMRDFLLTGLLQSRGILDPDEARKAFDNSVTPRDQSLLRLFHLCMIENWARQQR